MPTPKFDKLNVDLAYRLGDPYNPETGAPVTYADDGVAYPAAVRDDCILAAARRVISMLGAEALTRKGMNKTYVKRETITATPHAIPTDCARIIGIDYYGKKMVYVPFDDGRRNSVYWQNVPMFDVDWTAGEIHLSNIMSTFEATLYYQREIPTLTHGGSEDLVLDSYMEEHVKDLAESLARRTHQEFGLVKQSAIADMQSHKDNM